MHSLDTMQVRVRMTNFKKCYAVNFILKKLNISFLYLDVFTFLQEKQIGGRFGYSM